MDRGQSFPRGQLGYFEQKINYPRNVSECPWKSASTNKVERVRWPEMGPQWNTTLSLEMKSKWQNLRQCDWYKRQILDTLPYTIFRIKWYSQTVVTGSRVCVEPRDMQSYRHSRTTWQQLGVVINIWLKKENFAGDVDVVVGWLVQEQNFGPHVALWTQDGTFNGFRAHFMWAELAVHF